MVRIGDTCTQVGDIGEIRSTPARRTFVNGSLAVVEGAATTGMAVVRGGSDNVFVEGKKVSRLGDRTTSGHIISSSPNVHCNGLR